MNTSFLKNKRLVVLMGGWSAEREISLKSGMAIHNALAKMNVESKLLDLTSEIDFQKILDFDIAFIALHGRGGEDGQVQSYLSDKGIIYTGSDSVSCEIAMNKIETKKIWRNLSLPTPDFVEIKNAGLPNVETTPHLSSEDDITALDRTFVVKPAREGSSFGISIVRPGMGSLEQAIEKAAAYDKNVIVEAFVEGNEITIPIVGNKVLTPIKIKTKNIFYDYEAKYLSDQTEYQELVVSMQDINLIKDFSWHAFSSLGCSGWGRVDAIQDLDGNLQLIEVNTVPGMTATSLVPKSAEMQGLSFDELILKILFLACE